MKSFMIISMTLLSSIAAAQRPDSTFADNPGSPGGIVRTYSFYPDGKVQFLRNRIWGDAKHSWSYEKRYNRSGDVTVNVDSEFVDGMLKTTDEHFRETKMSDTKEFTKKGYVWRERIFLESEDRLFIYCAWYTSRGARYWGIVDGDLPVKVKISKEEFLDAKAKLQNLISKASSE